MPQLNLRLIPLFIMLTIIPVYGQSKIGLFDQHQDIGACQNAGFATFQAKDQTYLIGGSGKAMWSGEDQFHYLWTTIQGDFILRAEIEFLGSGVDPHRKVGWIVKNDLNSETPHVNATTHGDGSTSLQYRRTSGGDTEEVISSDSSPDVIQLERRGNDFIMSTAKFGEEFIEVSLTNMPLERQAYVGLYVCAHNPDAVEVAKFRNVRIVQPAGENLVPYTDYLGSHLEVMEVATGHRKILHSTTFSIQAPNWSVDGEKLIYNSEGRLYNYHLKEKSI